MKVLSEETKEKLRIAATGRKLSSEKIKPAQTFLPNEKISEETRAKLRAAKLGRIVDEETRKKISDALKKRKLSEQQKQLISEQHTGFKHSEDSRKKMSLSHMGIKRSEETRAKMDGNKLGISNVVAYRKVRDADTGEEFISMKAAAEKYDIFSSSISASCRQNKRVAGHLFEYVDEQKARERRKREDKPNLIITVPFEDADRIREEAAMIGKSVSGYILDIIREKWEKE